MSVTDKELETMTDQHRDYLRRVMKMAWDFARAEPGRAFGDCLRGAWKMMKGLAEAGRHLMRAARGARCVQLSPLLYRSPTANRSPSRWLAYKAARVTAQVGL
jgi:hypothetical protein